jgi:hypothetical protein
MKGYNLADDCPPGAKYFNRTKSGFRLIPGDRCLPSSVSRQLLKTEQLPCVGHEEEAGFDNAREAIRRAGVTAGRVVGGVIIALIVVAFAVVAFYCFLRCREHSPATYEKVLYQKLPMVDAAAGAGEEGDVSSSDDDLLNPSSSSTTTSAPSTKNPFENT